MAIKNINFLAWALLVTFFTSAQCKIEEAGDPHDGVILSLQAAIEGLQKAQALGLALASNETRTRDQIALQDCLKLFEDTFHRLNGSLNSIKTSHLEKAADMASVHTWVSAALTNQQMCLDGFSGTNYNREKYNGSIDLSEVGSSISLQVSNVSRLISDSLALFTSLNSSSPAAAGKRRVLSYGEKMGVPEWILGIQRRRLLQSSADVVVAQDGSGDFKTITEGLSAYVRPHGNGTYFVMYIKAGRYYENVVIDRNMTNLMMIGDGMDKTYVMGSRSVGDSESLFSSATFAVWADGFIASKMSFVNTAGPDKFQAVALLMVGDQSAIFQCSVEGYQDTLFLHSNRQFVRECYISGTVDFIFGNAAAVIQKSTVLVRKPLCGQKNVIVAQGRTDPNQNTGIILHATAVSAAPDLLPVQRNFTTYIGRAWRPFSRSVVMQSTLDDLIDPAGWLPRNSSDVYLDTLFFGEFQNNGGGAGLSKRVKWPGFHVINKTEEAKVFSVGQFIDGGSWLSSTGVAYDLSIF